MVVTLQPFVCCFDNVNLLFDLPLLLFTVEAVVFVDPVLHGSGSPHPGDIGTQLNKVVPPWNIQYLRVPGGGQVAGVLVVVLQVGLPK